MDGIVFFSESNQALENFKTEFGKSLLRGFNGQIGVYGVPSGRLLKILPVFSVFPENGYGYSEETKPMLNTSHGAVPWDDLHHIALSTTNLNYNKPFPVSPNATRYFNC